jgi:hypothetical protein
MRQAIIRLLGVLALTVFWIEASALAQERRPASVARWRSGRSRSCPAWQPTVRALLGRQLYEPGSRRVAPTHATGLKSERRVVHDADST